MSSSELLRKAAEALDEGTDPFSGSFLTDNDVTFDQCMALGQQLATGARIVARAIERPGSEEAVAMFMTMAREETGS
jgi:hypothetical protein